VRTTFENRLRGIAGIVIHYSRETFMIWDDTPRGDRFDITDEKKAMKAVVTAGNGGYDQLQCRSVQRPEPAPGEVLVQVLAAGVNNTEINTRVGWYSSSVTTATEDAALTGAAVPGEDQPVSRADGGWNEATPFPFIQGTDCCGRVVAAGADAGGGVAGADAGGDAAVAGAPAPDPGARVLVRPCMRKDGFSSMENTWMGSDFDGAFAQFVTVPVNEVFPVSCDWSDAELATIPCAYGTAENMVHRSGVRAGETVLVTGASGGVGSAVVQLARRRGARVIAVTSPKKTDVLYSLGADQVIERGTDLAAVLGGKSVDVVIDNVAGSGFGALLTVLNRGGRYVSSGAIAGPLVTLDMRTFYLKDLTLVGCTAWDEPVFPNLISYIEGGELRPLLAKTYPLNQVAEAQQDFLQKNHVGNFVLIPPPPGAADRTGL
jgi:NADPH:quinone reductase-like Zn-dependent oxidoreductase